MSFHRDPDLDQESAAWLLVLPLWFSKPWHTTCNLSEKLWHRSGGDWGIGHAGRGSGSARDRTVSGASHRTISPWAQWVRESSSI